MENSLHFTASTNIKNLFGKGLVTDQVAAVFELVKNSFDADARNVHIKFDDLDSENPKLTIIDDGTGMSLDDIKEKWMVIGTNSKKNMMFSPIFNRPLNGDKGIGRFSVDRLGKHLKMEAIKADSNTCIIADFDWTLFDNKSKNIFDNESKNIEDVLIPYTIKEETSVLMGVKLKISGLRDQWNENKIKELVRNLRQFKSPLAKNENFSIYITASKYGYEKFEITVEKIETISSLFIEAEITSKNPEVILLTVNKDGFEYEETMPNIYSFGSAKALVYFFNQGDKIRFKNKYSVRVKEFGNIRLYRDSFRIYPYGEENNDWLDIDKRQSQGFSRHFGNRDLIGYVQTSKATNPGLIPLTSRQGLVENKDFAQLRKFIVDVCVKKLEKYYFDTFKKNTNETIVKTKKEINFATTKLQELAKDLKTENPEAAATINQYARIINNEHKNQLKYVEEQKELVKVYSRIAKKETLLHQIIHQAMIHVSDAIKVYKYVIPQLKSISDIQAEKLSIMRECMDEALELLVTVRDDIVRKREKRLISLTSELNRFFNERLYFYKENNIHLELMLDDSIEYVMDRGDLTAIINNLVTNSEKSLMKVLDRKRILKIELNKTDKFVLIKVQDSGIGISETERERIFDPFVSTTNGFGLGLTIIDEITREYRGALELIDTKKVGACFLVKLRCN